MYNILKTKVMKKNFLWSMLATMMVGLLSIGLTSCDSKSSDPDEVSVMGSGSFSKSGGYQTITVKSNTDWTVSGAPGWLSVSPSQGKGNGSFTITASENKEKSSRNCTLYINAGSASTQIGVYQDGGPLPSADEVSGSYTGSLKPMGYSDDPARCYVTLSKLSSDAVRLEKLICEEFGLDMNPVNLIVKEEGDGRITLRSETSKAVEGSYYQGQLTLSFSNSLATFYFSGTKN